VFSRDQSNPSNLTEHNFVYKNVDLDSVRSYLLGLRGPGIQGARQTALAPRGERRRASRSAFFDQPDMARAQAMQNLDTGNTGFMLLCSLLVMLMTPGLAFFYG